MLKKIQKVINIESLLLILILLFKFLILFLLLNTLKNIHYVPQNFFILELLGIDFQITSSHTIIFDLLNVLLIWLISRAVIEKRFVLIPPLLYAVLPWNNYLSMVGSFYIYLLFLVLLLAYTIIIQRAKRNLIGNISTYLIALMLFFSSWMSIFILPTVVLCFYFLGFLTFKKLKPLFLLLIFLLLSFSVLFFNKSAGFTNILKNDVRLFNDPGLLNSVNEYQGASRESGYVYVSKMAENKYLYTLKAVWLKILKHFTPSTYFTAQEKLLGFSFTSPIYFGLIIPFCMGIYLWLKTGKNRKAILILSLPAVPSLLSKQLVDLNRLVLIAPIIIFVISWGLIGIIKYNNNKHKYILLGLTIIVVIVQLFSMISDINLRERQRFIRYYDQQLELGKQ